LKEPVFWKLSHLRRSRTAARSPRVRDESTGVRWMCGAVRAAASRMASIGMSMAGDAILRAMPRAARKLALRFPAEEIPYWASRFPGPEGDRLLDSIRARVRARGCLTRKEFLALCAWKSPRSRPRCLLNSERDVRAVTRAALASSDEAVKVELLRVLRGVDWATASTILHACDARPYPILDVRALWSLGATRGHVTLDLWLD